MSRIHPTAVIDPAAELDGSVEVGPYTVIDAGVQVGADTWIGPHVVLRGPMTIGRDNRIFQFCSLGEISQDKSARREDATRVEIGNGNTIREYVTIQRGTLKEQGLTRVGDDNWIMAQAHIAHDCMIGSQTILANGTTLAGHVTIEDHVGLGGYTLVHQFCRVGAHAYTGGGAVVLRDLPPFVIAEGQPARPRGINTEGLKRRGFTAEDIEAIKDAYKAIYLSGALMSEVKQRLAEMAKGSAHVGRMLAFIESSKRALSR
ncbi:MAG: acyl-ACP--UDP-N-acetylglucosamine O-acyltransferase [Sinimarinibacterium flocculans]|uniref:Acyl-[acyl-carrier-protein]--UDP-N-acetylglucosamine O-acyltransferase n=1 Tax=Sinimarinibacterium flocculans TaxID=985250 RepID=A0A318E8V2_9GAMM|nr:acyl-ACP--UDP-N-acetylglucosamine O-acyltransferase [Sinimarinibacterium flocculans]MEC9363450.1 acyl-ACP--UDP-N-acetylglucosamine O-acyltransferase [Pseudomonadota bacterium]PXV68447.1 acyl-[acyl-carrier-protein]--UDP-N-acetylglucosamine O-acyltransferase [Sinimarinibacterium flocculans]